MRDRLGYRRGREEGMNTVAMATGLLLPPLFDGSSGVGRGPPPQPDCLGGGRGLGRGLTPRILSSPPPGGRGFGGEPSGLG